MVFVYFAVDPRLLFTLDVVNGWEGEPHTGKVVKDIFVLFIKGLYFSREMWHDSDRDAISGTKLFREIWLIYLITVTLYKYLLLICSNTLLLSRVSVLFNLWIKSWIVAIQMRAIKQYFPVVFFITIPIEILRCGHKNKS